MIAYTRASTRAWSMLGSSGSFGIAAMELPDLNSSVAILTADLSFFSGLDRFRAKYPERLFNVGIAEQNMLGVAAGMAKEGHRVFATTYATFASARTCDQVRVNLGYMQADVKLVGLAAGLSVGILGPTHMSIEDLAVMRAIPNMTVVSPADCTATVKATLAAAQHKGPMYLRLSGVQNNPTVYPGDFEFTIGKAIKLREGDDIAIIATGTMVHAALEAATLLAERQIACTVLDMHTIKPLDEAAVKQTLGAKLLVTIEEHSVKGGLGGAVAECLAPVPRKPPQLVLGMADTFSHPADYPYLLEQHGLTPRQLAASILASYDDLRRGDVA
jgi:transketolase